MGDDFRKCLRGGKARLRWLQKEKTNIIRAISILILSMGVFFCTPPREMTLAKSANLKKPSSLSELTPEKKLGTFVYKDLKERRLAARLAEDMSKRAGKAGKLVVKVDSSLEKELKSYNPDEQKITTLIAGHPMEKMTPHIAKRKKEVASFLVAIAKKESDWGTYSPKKSGRDCYNYWGYKGGYNLTESGYSCFDSPEQAVQEVGDRIEKLLGQQINTPSRMVVWKCGRTCAGHDPAGVAKWISDVALYYGKLNS
ncbi:MAG TPA: hypothetical protein VF390_02875 [Patescibacteria group bacterium]